jgi:hypothetical protein
MRTYVPWMGRAGRRSLLAVGLLLAAVSLAGLAAAETNATVPAENATVTAGSASAADPTGTRVALPGDAGQTDSGESILLTQEIRLTPDRPGQIDVQYRLLAPDRVSDVRMRVPPDARNVRTTRFTRIKGNIYEWPGQTSTASITVTVPANRTSETVGPESTDGRLRFVDVGDWALVRRPRVATPGYTYQGDNPGVTVRNVTAGEGVIGQGLVYMGPHKTVERSAHGQRFRLVVPAAATLAEDRERILDSVTDASDRLRVGDRDGQVLMIAAPAGVAWGQLGLQTGPRDFYVRADEPVDTPSNTWVHEYVHTRQDFETTDGTEWFYEATAEYYAGQLTLESDRIDYAAFRDYLDRATREQFASVRLREPGTWTSNAGNYFTGALVVGELDRRVRLATDSEATFQAVFRQMNRHPEPVTHSDFLGFVRSAGGDGIVDPARRYTETTDRPETWSARTYRDAFGQLPPLFRYTLPDRESEDIRVTGETIVFDVTVANDGGAAGTYDLAVTVDGANVASRSGRLEADASTTETVEYTFAEAGSHTFSTGEESRTFRVREPATPAVADLSADRQQLRPGEEVTVTATVENPADRPGERTLTIRRDDTELTTEEVRLTPGSSTEVSATVTLDSPGTHRFSADDRTVSVTVFEGETTDAGTGASTGGTATPGGGDGTGSEVGIGAAGPGFGPLAALAGVLLLALSRRFERVE